MVFAAAAVIISIGLAFVGEDLFARQLVVVAANIAMLFLVSLAAIYVVSSLGEEVVYRGFLINRLEELFGGGRKATWVAVILSSLIFGLAHFGWGIVGVVQTTFMGFALAGSYLLFRRNLWILVAAHAYMDTVLIVPMYFG